MLKVFARICSWRSGSQAGLKSSRNQRRPVATLSSDSLNSLSGVDRMLEHRRRAEASLSKGRKRSDEIRLQSNLD